MGVRTAGVLGSPGAPEGEAPLPRCCSQSAQAHVPVSVLVPSQRSRLASLRPSPQALQPQPLPCPVDLWPGWDGTSQDSGDSEGELKPWEMCGPLCLASAGSEQQRSTLPGALTLPQPASALLAAGLGQASLEW